MTIRGYRPADLAAVLDIQRENRAAGCWAEDDYARLANDPHGFILVAGKENLTPPQVVGFAAYRSVTEDAELLNLAVTPGQQRRGVGSALVRAGVERLREKGARRVWLEVRESNHGAREFYRRIGFVQQGRRPDYYNDPCEDALLLELEFQRQSSQLLGRR